MDLFKKSVDVLKKMQLPNGGILATPLNGAYPYIYTRDGTISALAFNALGLTRNAEKFFHFILKNSRFDHYGEIFQRYTEEGLPSVSNKGERDSPGLVLHGIYETYKKNKSIDFLNTMWPLIEHATGDIIKHSRNGLLTTERSIHEFYRLEHGYEIWANSVSCRGLYDAAEIADISGHKRRKSEFLKAADKIKDSMRKRMFNKKTGTYIKNTKFPDAPDMSILAPFYFGIDDSKEILKDTMTWLRKTLWNREVGGFRRFVKFAVCKDWHWYTGGSGSWLALTAWGARFYKQVGDQKRCKECIDWIEEIGDMASGLLPEHVATVEEYDLWRDHEIEYNRRIISGIKIAEKMMKKFKNNIIPWATPLAWSHAEYILIKKNHDVC